MKIVSTKYEEVEMVSRASDPIHTKNSPAPNRFPDGAAE